MTNERHARFNQWRETTVGRLFCDLTLRYGRVRMQRKSKPVRPNRVYVGGAGKWWFYFAKS